MKFDLSCAIVASFIATSAAASPTLDIRFCPSAQVRSYPAESRRHVQSLLLQNVVVANRGPMPVDIREVDVDLMRGDQVIDTRRIAGADLVKYGDAGRAIQAGGMLDAVPFQFCGHELIAPGTRLEGPHLAAREAMLLMQQAFTFNGVRNQLRVRVQVDGGESVGVIPIDPSFTKNNYIFPLRGVWLAGNGPTFHTGHRWALPEEFAFDIAKLGPNGLSHRGDGTRFSDYYGYGADVLAAADGRVVAVANDQAEDVSAMQRPDESQEGYFARLQQEQAQRLTRGTSGLAGNYVMIDHGQGEYSLYAHMQPGSVRVHVGDAVRSGQVIGRLGSSGNSTEPHLHFQVCDRADPLMCAGIPVNFTNIMVMWADVPRPLQSGDIVVAR